MTLLGDEDRIRCDGVGCNESHPRRHDQLGGLGFGIARWLGWVYVDLNRPDVLDRELRFCSMLCAVDWLMLRGAVEVDPRIGLAYPRGATVSGELERLRRMEDAVVALYEAKAGPAPVRRTRCVSDEAVRFLAGLLDNVTPCPECHGEGQFYEDSMLVIGVPGGLYPVAPCEKCNMTGLASGGLQSP